MMESHGFSWNKGMLDFVDDWFLMGNVTKLFLIILSYLLFVLKIGPDFMKNRPAYSLKNTIVLYNAVQVAVSCFIFYLCCKIMIPHGLWPNTCLLETEDTRRKIAEILHYYFLAKVSETLDTVFFVLRKKHNQVTFLHVYHHSIMIFTSWGILKHEPIYPLLFMRNINSLVHIVMYTYYGMSAFPGLMKYLWWKNYITALQVVQISLVVVHYCIAAMFSGCTPSFYMSTIVLSNTFLMLYLFIRFYIDTYNKKHSIEVKNEGVDVQHHNVVNACG